jgi:ABC-type phosphate/phosphonate transport system substrate-binding protein
MSIASLPWYELSETRVAQDSVWALLARQLRRIGVRGVPKRLTRGPSVGALLSDRRLLIGQCCGYDLIYGFAGSVELVATPRYSAPGCEGANYRSLILVRADCPAGDLDDLRGLTCAINSFNSHSGTNALRALVAPLSRDGRFFSKVKVTGAHIDSLTLLRAGEADVMAMDCVLHALLSRHRPEALHGTRVLCWSDPVPAPPIITSAIADRNLIEKLREALTSVLSDEASREARGSMLLLGIEILPLQDYVRIIEIEAGALRHGYMELHATTPAWDR